MKIKHQLELRSRAWLATVLLGLTAAADPAPAGSIKSVGVMTFTDANTLVIADWRAGEIHALHLAPVNQTAPKPFNLKNISAPVAKALHTRPDGLRIEDMVLRPGAELAYLSVSVEHGTGLPQPALLTVDAAGEVKVLNLAKIPQTSATIKDRPATGKNLWRDVPEATLTVTDMAYANGKLYVAGLADATFASTLRVYDFPFTGAATATSIEMYHAVHDETETRAPIRKLTVATLNGEPSLVAAYTCTPLVTIPIKDLHDGAHIVGKTISELGWGSAPVDMVTFDAGQGPMILLINSHKSADLMTVASIAGASLRPGITTPIKWPNEPYLGLRSTPIPMAGVTQLSDQDKDYLCALRRNAATGDLELVSVRKGAFLRLSDFVNEFDFADYDYAHDSWSEVHKTLRIDEGYPDLARRINR